MKITKLKTKAAEIEFSKTELYALKQIFNEACHGIKIANFEETIGVCENEAEQFFDYFKDLEKRTSPGSPIVYKKPKQQKKSVDYNRKKCCLYSKDYDLCFFIRELDRTDTELGLIVVLAKEKVLFARTDGDRILIEELRQEITLLKEGINSFSQEIDFQANYSFFKRTLHVNLSTTELDKSQLTIEFVFEPRKQVDSSDTPARFTSVTTPDNITNFISEVEDFLESI